MFDKEGEVLVVELGCTRYLRRATFKKLGLNGWARAAAGFAGEGFFAK